MLFVFLIYLLVYLFNFIIIVLYYLEMNWGSSSEKYFLFYSNVYLQKQSKPGISICEMFFFFKYEQIHH